MTANIKKIKSKAAVANLVSYRAGGIRCYCGRERRKTSDLRRRGVRGCLLKPAGAKTELRGLVYAVTGKSCQSAVPAGRSYHRTCAFARRAASRPPAMAMIWPPSTIPRRQLRLGLRVRLLRHRVPRRAHPVTPSTSSAKAVFSLDACLPAAIALLRSWAEEAWARCTVRTTSHWARPSP